MLATLLLAGDLYFAPLKMRLLAPYHTNHESALGKDAPWANREVLAAIDQIQAREPKGGGYFIGVKADPPESPIGYALYFKDRPLLKPSRGTSYCSGASYAAFIEALNRILVRAPEGERFEQLRMQESDGGRRNDEVKAWGWWNADGFGSQFAMVQYLGVGKSISVREALPGDFMNISWKSGIGHSVVFLGWHRDAEDKPCMLYWSSQKGTHGLGDAMARLDTIQELCAVRLTDPEGILTFLPRKVDRKAAVGEKPPEF